MDIADRASKHEMETTRIALAERRMPRMQPNLVCADCGDPNDQPEYKICTDCRHIRLQAARS